jgi:biopolymer transport protein ExbB/TolQ
MTQIASLLDVFLIFLVTLNGGLITYKAIQLYTSFLKNSAIVQMAESPAKLDIAMEHLEGGLTLLAILASSAPFIGLGGTVLHIMDALRGMGGASVDMSIISGPITTALNATLWGLAIAVPASVAHALFSRRLQLLENRATRQIKATPLGNN